MRTNMSINIKQKLQRSHWIDETITRGNNQLKCSINLWYAISLRTTGSSENIILSYETVGKIHCCVKVILSFGPQHTENICGKRCWNLKLWKIAVTIKIPSVVSSFLPILKFPHMDRLLKCSLNCPHICWKSVSSINFRQTTRSCNVINCY